MPNTYRCACPLFPKGGTGRISGWQCLPQMCSVAREGAGGHMVLIGGTSQDELAPTPPGASYSQVEVMSL